MSPDFERSLFSELITIAKRLLFVAMVMTACGFALWAAAILLRP
jgi:hypothetical protein